MENWQVFTIIGANLAILLAFTGTSIGLFLWSSNKTDKLGDLLMKEMKEFHGRLCALEEKYKKMEKK